MSPKTTPMAPSARAAAPFFWCVVVPTDLGLDLLLAAPGVAPPGLADDAAQNRRRYLGRSWSADKHGNAVPSRRTRLKQLVQLQNSHASRSINGSKQR